MTTNQRRKRTRESLLLPGLFLGLLLTGIPFVEAEPEIRVNLRPEKSIKIGKGAELTIEVVWRSEEGNYQFPEPVLTLDRLQIEEVGETNEVFHKEGSEWKRKIFRFRLKGREAGKARIHPFRVDYLEPARGSGGHLEVASKELGVTPDRTGLYQGLLGSFLFLVGGGMAWWFVKRSRASRLRESVAQRPSLEERTADELRQIQSQEELLELGKCLRNYLSEKYSVPGTVSTGRELLLRLEGNVPRDEWRALKRTLEKLDEWSYSRPPNLPGEWNQLCEEVIQYVAGKQIVEKPSHL